MNYEAVLFYKQQRSAMDAPNNPGDIGRASEPSEPSTSNGTVSKQEKERNLVQLHSYCKPAVQGFFQSIALSSGSSLQDTLRLLTLWFDYGQWQEVYEALNEGIKNIQIDNWLQVSCWGQVNKLNTITNNIKPFYRVYSAF